MKIFSSPVGFFMPISFLNVRTSVFRPAPAKAPLIPPINSVLWLSIFSSIEGSSLDSKKAIDSKVGIGIRDKGG